MTSSFDIEETGSDRSLLEFKAQKSVVNCTELVELFQGFSNLHEFLTSIAKKPGTQGLVESTYMLIY